MTGSPDLATPCKGVEELVADGFLVKPVGLQTLLSCVQARVRSCPSSVRVRRSIACGARAVLIGRPVLWGLATGAETGVRYVLEMVRQEFDLAMALSGCPTLNSITRDLIRRS
jgi:FMN-dependent dehydrogenase